MTDASEITNGQTIDFLDAFQKATQDDLDAIRSRIDELNKEIEGLKVIEKAVSVRLNGAQPTKPRRRHGGGRPPKNINKIRDYLEVAGAKKPATIAAETGIDVKAVSGVLNAHPDIFRKLPDGWALT